MTNTYFTHFIISTLASSALILLILLMKRLLNRHISTRWQYNIGLFTFILLSVPFIPARLLNFANDGSWLFNGFHFNTTMATGMTASTGTGTQALVGMGWLQDFTMSVDRATPGYFMTAFLFIWLVGIVILALFTLFCNRELRLIKESVKPIADAKMLALFANCKDELCVKRNIHLGTSILVKSPMTIGLFKTQVILPNEIWKIMSVEEIRYILLHELTHCKNMDIPINNLMCLFQALYWFNPIVFIAFKELRLEREMACDLTVLGQIPKAHHIDYGRTLLRFAHRLSSPAALSLTTDIGGSKKQIKKRVENIASFRGETILLKIKSFCVFAITGLLIFSQVPAISALAAYDDGKYYFGAANVEYQDLSSFFDGFEGSFVLYDMEADAYTIHNKDKSVTRVSPDSTYKIYSALIALETGIIGQAQSIQEWDGIAYPYEAWNHDHTLISAMQNSVSWYFQNTDARVGIKDLKDYYTKLNYGNCDLSGGLADYWMESTLRISPVEQVLLLKDFYNNNTIFKPEHVDTLKDILLLSEKDGATLSGKTGTGSVNSKAVNGWFIGCVQKDGHSYIFATNIGGKDKAYGSAAAQITLNILKDKGIY